ncbi:hypothetical protein M422DRAFT_264710 [Sphaerobolus stellatus SS14]|uniref:Uncharacterized protein n=1 Tax=Sphaerobolus stellatus (strain SS14) TaxID=990650 RepID=A0A0C9UVM2_SPHS4|nr:hypothetical protein M422DRAFT_264710 [Sphaerobolus stellatus SS14]
MPKKSRVNLQCIKNLPPCKNKELKDPTPAPTPTPIPTPSNSQKDGDPLPTAVQEMTLKMTLEMKNSDQQIDEDGEAEILDDQQLVDFEQRHAANQCKLAEDPKHQFISKFLQPKVFSQNASETDASDSEALMLEDNLVIEGQTPPLTPAPLNEQEPVSTEELSNNEKGLHVNEAHQRLQEMLCDLTNNAPRSVSDSALASLFWKDFPKLHWARDCLSVKNKDKTSDIVFHSHITAMVATLNFYLDVELSYTRQEASVLAANAAEQSAKFAWNIREWLHTYLSHQKLPMHRYGCHHSSILEDEDLQEPLQLGLLEKAKDG